LAPLPLPHPDEEDGVGHPLQRLPKGVHVQLEALRDLTPTCAQTQNFNMSQHAACKWGQTCHPSVSGRLEAAGTATCGCSMQ
jgi:hypothetical protein